MDKLKKYKRSTNSDFSTNSNLIDKVSVQDITNYNVNIVHQLNWCYPIYTLKSQALSL